MSSSDEVGIPLIEATFDPTAPSKKRKREADQGTTPEDKKAAKKAKRKQKKALRAKEISEDDLDLTLHLNRAFSRLDSQLLADYVNARTRLYGKDLSSVELEDRFLPARTVRDTSGYEGDRTLDNLAGFLKKQCGKLEATPKTPTGAPHTLVVTASGIRAADVFRALKGGLPKVGVKEASVAKLFAKHMKVGEQVEHLKKNKYVYHGHKVDGRRKSCANCV